MHASNAAGDFSMSAFCAAAASAAHGPPQRGKRKQPFSNPKAHRLFSLKLEFVSVGIASPTFGAKTAGIPFLQIALGREVLPSRVG